jgi:phosphatidylinositol glycan class P protein
VDHRRDNNAIGIFRPSSPYLHPVDDDDDDFTDDDVSTDEDEENEDEADEHNGANGFPSFEDVEREHLYTTRSHPHLPPSSSQLFPPFYNRPPTPLPPSPSLTSLLRPSFSTHTSHHTTPESSDTEPGSATFPTATHLPTTTTTASSHKPQSTINSATSPHNRPRAYAKIPTYEYYGFALYLASSLFFLMYTLWAYLPSPFLHQLGIYYYPNRWWALAVPAFLVMCIVYIYVALAAYNTEYLTLPMTSLETIVDDAAKVATIDSKGRIHPGEANRQIGEDKARGLDWRGIWNEGTDAVMDVPLAAVNEVLYGFLSDGEENDEECL